MGLLAKIKMPSAIFRASSGVALVLAVALSVIAGGTLWVYREHKQEELRKETLGNAIRASHYLQGRMEWAAYGSPAEARGADDVIFLLDEACSPEHKLSGFLSPSFAARLSQRSLKPLDWTDTLASAKLCPELAGQGARSGSWASIPSEIDLGFPAIPALVKTASGGVRALLLSMDSYVDPKTSVLVLLDGKGELLWASSRAELDEFFKDTGISKGAFQDIAQAAHSTEHQIQELGPKALVSFASVDVGGSHRTIVTLVNRPKALHWLALVWRETLIGILALFCLALLGAASMAEAATAGHLKVSRAFRILLGAGVLGALIAFAAGLLEMRSGNPDASTTAPVASGKLPIEIPQLPSATTATAATRDPKIHPAPHGQIYVRASSGAQAGTGIDLKMEWAEPTTGWLALEDLVLERVRYVELQSARSALVHVNSGSHYAWQLLNEEKSELKVSSGPFDFVVSAFDPNVAADRAHIEELIKSAGSNPAIEIHW